MAYDFLQLSATYRETTKPDILRRRAVIAKHLGPKYRVARGQDARVLAAIRQDLAQEGLEINKPTFQADKHLIRAAHRFLQAPEEEKRRMEKLVIGTPGGRGVRCLVKDGIRTWADVEALRNPRPAVPEPPAPAPEPEPVPGPQQRLDAAFADIRAVLAELAKENAGLQQQLGREHEVSEMLQRDLGVSRASLDEARGRVRQLDALDLARIAASHPEFPELADIAARMGDTGEAMRELVARLPERFAWRRNTGRIVYSQFFLRTFAELPREDQGHPARRIEYFAREGPKQKSFKTRKSQPNQFPHSPTICSVSWLTDDLFITWSERPGQVTIHWLCRKGDPRAQ